MELFSFSSLYSLFCYIILKNGPVNLHTLSKVTKMGTEAPDVFPPLLSHIQIPFLDSFPLPHPVFFRLPITYTFPAELMHVAPSAH